MVVALLCPMKILSSLRTKVWKGAFIVDYGKYHPLFYSNNFCVRKYDKLKYLYWYPYHSIKITDGTLVSCVRHVSCAHLVGTKFHQLAPIIFGMVGCCWCNNMAVQKVRYTLLTQGISNHSECLNTPLVHVILGYCGWRSSFIWLKFPLCYGVYGRAFTIF